jgi:hypothetical protein
VLIGRELAMPVPRRTPSSRKAKYYAGGDLESEAVGDAAIAVHGEIFAAHIASQTRIRISLYILAAVFVGVSALLVVFAHRGARILPSQSVQHWWS